MTELDILKNVFFGFFNNFGRHFLLILYFGTLIVLIFGILKVILRR